LVIGEHFVGFCCLFLLTAFLSSGCFIVERAAFPKLDHGTTGARCIDLTLVSRPLLTGSTAVKRRFHSFNLIPANRDAREAIHTFLDRAESHGSRVGRMQAIDGSLVLFCKGSKHS
jgi:hypothetical protein